jgi:hypothetical protein
MNQETSTYAMSIAEIAANLGVSERAVRFILRRAIFKTPLPPSTVDKLSSSSRGTAESAGCASGERSLGLRRTDEARYPR